MHAKFVVSRFQTTIGNNSNKNKMSMLFTCKSPMTKHQNKMKELRIQPIDYLSNPGQIIFISECSGFFSAKTKMFLPCPAF